MITELEYLCHKVERLEDDEIWMKNEHEHDELCKRELQGLPDMSTKYCLIIKEETKPDVLENRC